MLKAVRLMVLWLGAAGPRSDVRGGLRAAEGDLMGHANPPPPPAPDRMTDWRTDTHDWKHYLPATLLTGDNKRATLPIVFFRRSGRRCWSGTPSGSRRSTSCGHGAPHQVFTGSVVVCHAACSSVICSMAQSVRCPRATCSGATGASSQGITPTTPAGTSRSSRASRGPPTSVWAAGPCLHVA